MSTFTLCFTFLHVLFERCNYFNNGCVLFSISFLSFLLLIFFLFVYRVSLRPGYSRHAAGGGESHNQLTPPPAHVYFSLSPSNLLMRVCNFTLPSENLRPPILSTFSTIQVVDFPASLDLQIRSE